MKPFKVHPNRLWDLAAGRLADEEAFMVRRHLMENDKSRLRFESFQRSVKGLEAYSDMIDATADDPDDAWARFEGRLNQEIVHPAPRRRRFSPRKLRLVLVPLMSVLLIGSAFAAYSVYQNPTLLTKWFGGSNTVETVPVVVPEPPAPEVIQEPEPLAIEGKVVWSSDHCKTFTKGEVVGQKIESGSCQLHVDYGSGVQALLMPQAGFTMSRSGENFEAQMTQGQVFMLFDRREFMLKAGGREFVGEDALFFARRDRERMHVAVLSGRVGIRRTGGDLRHLLLGPQRWMQDGDREELGLVSAEEKSALLDFAERARHGYPTQTARLDDTKKARSVRRSPVKTVDSVAMMQAEPKEEACDEHPDAQRLYREGKYAEALEAVENEIRNDPSSCSDLYYLQGLIHTALKDPRRAVDAFAKVQEKGSGELVGRALYEEGRVLADLLHQPGKARIRWDRYLAKYPNGMLVQDVLSRLCEYELEQGESGNCQTYLQRFSDGFRAPQIHWALAKLALDHGQYREALDHLKQIKETMLAPTDRESWRYLQVYCYAGLNRPDPGRTAARVYLRHHADGQWSGQVRDILQRWKQAPSDLGSDHER